MGRLWQVCRVRSHSVQAPASWRGTQNEKPGKLGQSKSVEQAKYKIRSFDLICSAVGPWGTSL